jgi:LacI family transcriptional regulator
MTKRDRKHKDARKGSITVRQIAELANVSLGTVSHVLNGSATVHEVRRKRVMDAVESLGYQPSQLARGLRSNLTAMLGMIIPDITNPFFPGVVRGAEDIAYKHGYRLVLCNTDNDSAKEISYLTDLRSFRPSGLLIIPSAAEALMRRLHGSDAHIVFVDRCPAEWDGDFVTVDNEGGAYQAGLHLLGLGHRKLAVITGPLNVSNAADRLRGFQRAAKEYGIDIGPEYIQEARFTSESGYTASLRLLQMLPRPTAIFASNDLLACGTLSAAEHLGLRCPEDVSVVGFDNLEFVEHTAPALTTVHQSGYQSAVLPTELTVRNSTMRAKGMQQKRKRLPSKQHG